MYPNSKAFKGFTQPRGLQVVNCKIDLQRSKEDASKSDTDGTTWVKYPTPVRYEEHTLKRGEFAFTMAGYESNTFDKQMAVRTVLNKVRAKLSKFKGSDRMSDERKKEMALMMTILPVGVIVNDVVFPSPGQFIGPNNVNPVIADSGHTTVTHTGDKRICSGNAVQVYFVNERKKQYNDGNRFSDDRKVLGVQPLEISRNLETVVDQCDAKNEFDTLLTKRNDGTEIDKKKGALFLDYFRAALFREMRNCVGVSSTSADAGERIDIMTQSPFNPLNFAKILTEDSIVADSSKRGKFD
jgi:hypothetical protein